MKNETVKIIKTGYGIGGIYSYYLEIADGWVDKTLQRYDLGTADPLQLADFFGVAEENVTDEVVAAMLIEKHKQAEDLEKWRGTIALEAYDNYTEINKNQQGYYLEYLDFLEKIEGHPFNAIKATVLSLLDDLAHAQ